MKKIILIFVIFLLSILSLIGMFTALNYRKHIQTLNTEISELNARLVERKSTHEKLESGNIYSDLNSERYDIDIELERCSAENFMTDGMNKCTYDGIAAWDKEMNSYILKIQQQLPKNKVILFNDSQKSWQDYYNKEESLLNGTISVKEGDIHTTITIGKLYDIKKQRVLFLKSYLRELRD